MNVRGANGLRIGVAAVIAGLVMSQGALAGRPDTETVTRTVHVRGLDLSSPAGAEQAYRQITAVAESICSGTIRTQKGVARVRQQHAYVRRCFDEAVEGALEEVAQRTGIDLRQVAASASHDALVAER